MTATRKERFEKIVAPKLYILAAAAGWLIFHHFYGYEGHFGADDLYYARIAHEITQGTYHWKLDDYYYRWGLLLPLAASYKLFGINDLSSALPALLYTGLTVFLLVQILSPFKFYAQILGAAFFLTSPWSLFYSDKIMPDCGVAFFALLSFYIFRRYVFPVDRVAWKTPYLFMAACFGGWLCKESFALLYPVFLGLFFFQRRERPQRGFWLRVLILHLICAVAYGAVCYWMTGRAFFRLEAIQAGAYRVAGCDYAFQPFVETLKRIGYQFWLMLIGTGFAVAIVLPFAHRKVMKLDEELRARFYFWTYILAGCLLSANFMTASPTAYSPLCLDPRHYLFIAPVAAAASGTMFTFFTFKRFFFLGSLVFLAIALIDARNGGEMWRFTYLPMAILCYARVKTSEKFDRSKWVDHTWVVLFCGVLLVYPLHYMQYSRSLRYDDQRQVVKEFFIDHPLTPKNIVVTNEIQKNFGEYYMGFENKGTTFITYEQAKTYAFPVDAAVYVLNVWLTNFRLGRDFQDLPAYAQRPPAGFTKIVENKGAVLYETKDIGIYK